MECINVVVLCGGKATRLGALTANKPKILVECDGQPFLDYLMNNLEWCWNKGLEEDRFKFLTITYATGTQNNSFYINDFIQKSWYRFAGNIFITDGEQRVGTAGSLKRCEKYLNKYIQKTLVINGDSFISKHMLYEFIKDGIESNINSMLLGMPMSHEGHTYSKIVYDYSGIINTYELTNDVQHVSSAGYYMLDRNVFSLIESDKVVSLENDIIPKLVNNLELKVFPTGYIEKFFDIGTPNGLAKFEEYLKYKKLIGEAVL